MSDPTLHRVDHHRPLVKNVSNHAPQHSGTKPFDPAKAAIKAASEPKPVEARGLHSLVLAEAMDGDGSEALNRAAIETGKRTGADDGAGQVTSRRGERSARPATEPKAEDKVELQGTRTAGRRSATNRNAASEGAARVESVRTPAMTSQSIASQHDELMMLSATMSRRDLATHLARKHAARLTEIFSGEAWRISREATNHLNAAQMPL